MRGVMPAGRVPGEFVSVPRAPDAVRKPLAISKRSDSSLCWNAVLRFWSQRLTSKAWP
jgi:hypothetical protein